MITLHPSPTPSPVVVPRDGFDLPLNVTCSACGSVWSGLAWRCSDHRIACDAAPQQTEDPTEAGPYTVLGAAGVVRLPAPGSIAELESLALQLRDALRGMLEQPSDEARGHAWAALARHRRVTGGRPRGG